MVRSILLLITILLVATQHLHAVSPQPPRRHSTHEDNSNEVYFFESQRSPRSSSTRDCYTASLYYAVLTGEENSVIDRLLDKGADPTSRDNDHKRPIYDLAFERARNHPNDAHAVYILNRCIEVIPREDRVDLIAEIQEHPTLKKKVDVLSIKR